MVKPAPSGTHYSYKKSTYLNADTSPTGTINNVKWFTDGAIGWTGVTLNAKTVTAYAQATGTEGTTGEEMSGGTNASGYTSGSPLSVGGSIDNPSTGKISDYVEMQAVLSDSAVAGTLAAETITWRYDET